MELETLKDKWVEYDRKLDVSMRLNRQLLMAANLNRVRSPMRRFAFVAGLGAVTGLVGSIVLGQFIYQHWAEPRFAWPAVALHVWVIATIAASIRQMVMALQVDYDRPVAVIQKQLEALQMLRIRITRWALLSGQVIWWIPFLIVALKGFWNVDAYKVFSGAFLLTNLAVGVALIPVAVWVSRKWGDRMQRSRIIRQLIRDVAGDNLKAANSFLARLSEFETEPTL